MLFLGLLKSRVMDYLQYLKIKSTIFCLNVGNSINIYKNEMSKCHLVAMCDLILGPKK